MQFEEKTQMYNIMGIDDCVAATPNDFVEIALRLAHNSILREMLTSRILAANFRLFEDRNSISEWDRFLTAVSLPQL